MYALSGCDYIQSSIRTFGFEFSTVIFLGYFEIMERVDQRRQPREREVALNVMRYAEGELSAGNYSRASQNAEPSTTTQTNTTRIVSSLIVNQRGSNSFQQLLTNLIVIERGSLLDGLLHSSRVDISENLDIR